MLSNRYYLTLLFYYITNCGLTRSGELRGHLQPLGSHTEPGNVEERTDIPTASEFWHDYVKISKPVVFRGAAKHSKAFKLWTDQYLNETYGKLEVRIENKDESIHGIPVGDVCLGRDTIGNFIRTYHTSNRYLVSELPSPMYGDISVPPCLTCGTFLQRFVEIDLWMSGGGSKSILHKDAFNAINCVINGTKQWKLIDYKYEKSIHKAYEPGNEIGGFSLINVSSVDMVKYPNIKDVPWSYVEINAGDCLFLPKSCYHQVNSLGTNNIAVAILFSRLDELVDYDDTGCDAHASDVYIPLSEIDVDWQYPGHGQMTMGNADLERVRAHLLELNKAYGPITKETLERYVEQFDIQRLQEPDFDKIFHALGKNSKGSIDEKDILLLNKTELRILALVLERYEPSNTYTHEYSYILAEDLSELIESILEGGGIERNYFVNAYMKQLGGSEKFGEEIFSGFQSTDPERATYEEVVGHLKDVLKPYIRYSVQDRGPLREDMFGDDTDEDEEGRNAAMLENNNEYENNENTDKDFENEIGNTHTKHNEL